jgi:hypothetical protein
MEGSDMKRYNDLLLATPVGVHERAIDKEAEEQTKSMRDLNREVAGPDR